MFLAKFNPKNVIIMPPTAPDISKYPESILELLQSKSFRKRPGMYLGAKDINVLKAYIDGYSFGEECYGGKKTMYTFFTDFREWLAPKTLHPETTGGWNHMILELVQNDQDLAFVKFFELMDEFTETNAPV